MAKLASRHCSPVKKGSKPLSPSVARSLLNQISNIWRFDPQVKTIECEFKFADYHRTIQFVNAVAWIANTEDHHPHLEIGYDRCKVTFSTHAADGLTVNDFICAAKIDALFKEPGGVAIANTGKTPATAAPGKPAAAEATTRPAKPKPAPASRGAELSFDFQEAEELLSENIELVSVPDDANAGSYEDEFQLIEPEVQPPAEEPQKAMRASKPEPAPAAATPAAPAKPPQGAIDMMSTVILPPGMQAVGGKPPYDDDEDATVIIPEEMQPDSSPESEPAPAAQLKSDDDEVKTVILGAAASGRPLNPDATLVMSPSLAAELVTQSQATPTPKPQTAPPQPPAAPDKLQTQRADDPDEIGTMILSSNPTNRPKPVQTPPDTNQAEEHQPDPDEVATVQTQDAADDPDKTIADDHMETMVLNAVDIDALTADQKPGKPKAAPATKPATSKTGKADPEIEEDDTLVMHVNSYQKVRHDKE